MAENLAERVAVTAVGEHIAAKIKFGDPDTGWAGDPFLVLTYDPDGYYRVWDTVGEEPYLVCQKWSDGRELDTRSLTTGLRNASFANRTIDEIVDDQFANNAAVDAAADKAQREQIAYEAERIAFQLGKELDR